MSFHDPRLRFPLLPSGAKVVFGALAAASRPTEDLTISEWSDRYRKVSPESGSPWPGDFRTDRVPYRYGAGLRHIRAVPPPVDND
ncbi:hypothetical protein [Tardiphaga sp. 813_E8_N1_3]|uniref:hypothetical protein n=1 Tax=Tardiphaga sp. 813_E8_N1_3 TaxID=3240760 RepID=UPI003F26D0A1